MKKIQLSDGMPTTANKEAQHEDTKKLVNQIKALCDESKLSYVEVNKALYLADTELYTELLNEIR